MQPTPALARPAVEYFLRMLLRLATILLVSASILDNAVGAEYPVGAAGTRAALKSISADDLQRHVAALASDVYEGRATGSQGGRAAGVYLVQQLRRIPVRPAGSDASFFQPFGNGSRNVLALLEGSDPHLKQQVIVVGAHYDHVGYGRRGNSYGPLGLIHHGADDNASGTAGLLELIQALSRLPQPPRRSVLFAFWDGEEEGLLGSRHFVENPTVPLARISLVVNMDMIGRLRANTLSVFGARTSLGLRRLVSEDNRQSDLTLVFNPEMKGNSDHFPFFERGIPVLMLHTGLHGDYHRPSDTADKINSDGMCRIVRLLFALVYDTANADRLSGFRAESRQESPETVMHSQDAMPAVDRLGVEWLSTQSETAGLLVSAVRRGSSVERAGVRAGDRIVSCNQRPITSGRELRAAIVVAESPARLTISRSGSTKLVDLSVDLAGKPQRFGIVWEEDPSEPGVVVVDRVTSDSPADCATLAVGDRIWTLGGQGFHDGKEFQRRVSELSGPVSVTIERQGHVRSVETQLPDRRGDNPPPQRGTKAATAPR